MTTFTIFHCTIILPYFIGTYHLCWWIYTLVWIHLMFINDQGCLWEPPERREGFWNYREGHSPTIVAAPIWKLWLLNWRMSSPCTSNAWWTASTDLLSDKGEPSWNWNRWPGADPLTAKKDSSNLTGQIRPSKRPRKIRTPTPNVSVLLWRKWSETKDGEERESTETSPAVSEGSSWAEPVNIPPQRKPKNLYSRLPTTSLHLWCWLLWTCWKQEPQNLWSYRETLGPQVTRWSSANAPQYVH